MFSYLRSAPKVLPSSVAASPRRPCRKTKARRLFLEHLEDRALLAGLNSVIDNLLTGFAPGVPPDPTQEFTYVNVTVGTTAVVGGTADLELENVILTFPDLAFDAAGNWTGNVVVKAGAGVLFPGLVDIAVEAGDDGDEFAVVGSINLAAGNDTSHLALDDIDAEQIGVPSFLDVQFTNLALNFDDFRADEDNSSLDAQIDLVGLDTGVDELNELMASDNPLFQLTLIGTTSATLDLTKIEVSGNTVAAFQEGLAAEMGQQLAIGLASGPGIDIAGKIFHVGDIAGKATFHTITVAGETSGYLAVEGGFRVADEELGGRGRKFDMAFAISDLGPLQFFITMSPEPAESPKVEPKGTIKVESASFGVIFNSTVEQLQTGIDFYATAAAPVEGDGGFFTLTIPAHDLEDGDAFAIVAADNANYLGEYEVESVSGNQVKFKMDVDVDPGTLASASIIRRTIKDPLDLRDDG